VICYIAGNFEAENSLNLTVTVVFGRRIHGNNTLLYSDIINVDFAIGTLRNYDGDGYGNVRKTIG